MHSYAIEVLGTETEDTCSCCGRPVFEGEGILAEGENELALYGYRYTSGHESRFTLGVCALTESGEVMAGLAVVRCRIDGGSLIYTVLDPDNSPWGESEALGKVLSRKEVLEDKAVPNLFDLVDAISARESRISNRVLAENDG